MNDSVKASLDGIKPKEDYDCSMLKGFERNDFLFYSSWESAISMLPKKSQGTMYADVIAFALHSKLPDFESYGKKELMCWKTIFPVLYKSQIKSYNSSNPKPKLNGNNNASKSKTTDSESIRCYEKTDEKQTKNEQGKGIGKGVGKVKGVVDITTTTTESGSGGVFYKTLPVIKNILLDGGDDILSLVESSTGFTENNAETAVNLFKSVLELSPSEASARNLGIAMDEALARRPMRDVMNELYRLNNGVNSDNKLGIIIAEIRKM